LLVFVKLARVSRKRTTLRSKPKVSLVESVLGSPERVIGAGARTAVKCVPG
jgi:hypothetical protein